MIREAADFLGIADPFFRVHEGIAGSETVIGNKTYVNFASYNYLGLNGHPYIADAAKAAIDRHGTTVSASRPVSGERSIHRELEQVLARIHGSEDCVVFVGGHSTNVTVIGHLLGRDD
ncbi:MAG TPA: aminotransferase class I/II-fold pyridoxal phosphate-dependent enzyme, partial [Pirellulales bacterium]|nr:aminotransferase class I/II-fold pyridoxal phosphate-dependent enzyme [Pirellulales bacterium]